MSLVNACRVPSLSRVSCPGPLQTVCVFVCSQYTSLSTVAHDTARVFL